MALPGKSPSDAHALGDHFVLEQHSFYTFQVNCMIFTIIVALLHHSCTTYVMCKD